MSAPEPPPATAPNRDDTVLWGVLGIALAFCCLPLGVAFSILSFTSARKAGTRPTLAYLGFVLSAVVLVVYVTLYATGNLDFSLSVG